MKSEGSLMVGRSSSVYFKPQFIRMPIALLGLAVLCWSLQATAQVYQFDLQWGTSGGGNGQFSGPHMLAHDSLGNVYVADAGNSRIQKFDPDGSYITQWGGSGSGDGQMGAPWGIAVDSTDGIYVADRGNNRIQKFTSAGSFVLKFGGPGTGDGQFNELRGVAADSNDNVYVVDGGNKRIQKFTSSGTFLLEWGSSGSADGQFMAPEGIAIDSSDNVYVADNSLNRIQKFDATGGYLLKWGTSGGGDGQFQIPEGVATDSNDDVFVTDFSNGRVQKFDSAGAYITKWGSAGSSPGQFSLPLGITVNNTGQVYVGELSGARIQRFSVLDTTPPNAITITPTTTGPTNATSAAFTVDFDEDVQNFSALADITLTHTGTASTGVSITGGPATYTATVTGISGDGSFTLAVDTGSDVQDLASNALASSVTSAAVTIDNTLPAYDSFAVTPQVATLGQAVSLTFTASEPLSADPFVYVNGNLAAYVNNVGLDYSYTYTVLGSDPDGSASVILSGVDLAGNAGGSSYNGGQLIIDNTAPSFSNVAVNPSEASSGTLVSIAFDGSEALAGDPDVTVNGNPATRTAKAPFAYEYNVLPTDPIGAATIQIDGIDLAGIAGSFSNSVALTIVPAAPNVPLAAWPLGLALAAAGGLALRRKARK